MFNDCFLIEKLINMKVDEISNIGFIQTCPIDGLDLSGISL